MGQTVSDTWFILHGEGATRDLRIRLHWGDEGIDETHPVGLTALKAMLGASTAGDLQVMLYAWMQSVPVSSAAWAKRAAFAASGAVAVGL